MHSTSVSSLGSFHVFCKIPLDRERERARRRSDSTSLGRRRFPRVADNGVGGTWLSVSSISTVAESDADLRRVAALLLWAVKPLRLARSKRP